MGKEISIDMEQSKARLINMLIFLVLSSDNGVSSNNNQNQVLSNSKYDKDLSSADLPVIFWWTARLDSSIRGPTALNKLYCPTTTCLTTNNRKFFKSKRKKVLMFYGSDIDTSDLPLPRDKSDEWALFHEESPMNNYMLTHGPFIQLFNYTSTFKRESDFPLTSQHIPSAGYLINRKPIPLKLKNKYRNDGMAAVLYIQSHCDVASDRDRYVKELMKFIKVDSYGKCLNNIGIPSNLEDPVENMHTEDFLNFIGRYKFHLSFENAICDDYMTEKLFRVLHVGSVPIYRGSQRVLDYIPNNHSVIIAENFTSPQKLAEYINILDNNDDQYLKYLEFKHGGVVNSFLNEELTERPFSTHGVMPDIYEFASKPDMINGFECYVCEKTTERIRYEKTEGIHNKGTIAKRSHLNCPQPYTSVGHPDSYPSSDSWLQAAWIEDYWSSLDKAIAVERMLLTKETDPKTFHHYWYKVFDEYSRNKQSGNF